MAPCKRQLKATRHLICGSCSNWVDFVKSGCEKSWAEVQADSFSFECRGCARMKELEVELEELRLLVVAMVGREQGSCAGSSGEGTVDDKVGKDTRDARESSPQPGRKLRGGKVTGHGGFYHGENDESRGGETEESRGGETEENKESSGNVREKAGKKKKDDRRQRMQQKRGKRVSGEGLPGGKTVKVDDMRERGHTSSVQQERSFADVVSQGKARKARVFMGDSIIRKVDKIVNRGDDITVCLPGAKVEDIAEKAGQVMGGGTGGAVLVHVGTNNADKEGTSAIIGKYRRLIKTLKEARVGQIILSGILPIMGGRGEEYRNCRRVAINTQVQKVCMEEGVGFVDMWLNFVGRGDFFMRDGLHLTGKGAAVLACEFVRVVDEGTGTIDYLN